LGTASDSGLSFEEWQDKVGRAPQKDWLEKAWPLVEEWEATRTGRIDGDAIYELQIRFEYARNIAATGQSFSDWRASVLAKHAASQEKAETLDWLMRVGPLIEEEERTHDPARLREIHARIEYESEHRESGLSFEEWKAKTEKRTDVELKEEEIARLRRELDAKDDEIGVLRSQITRYEDDVDKGLEVIRAWQRAAFWRLFWWFVLLDLAVTVLLCWPAYSAYHPSFWIAIALAAVANGWMAWVFRGT